MKPNNIRFFDMFAGIGGFRAGLERAGGFTYIGHCEVDKYADRAYRAVIKESGAFYAAVVNVVRSIIGLRLKATHVANTAATGANKKDTLAAPPAEVGRGNAMT